MLTLCDGDISQYNELSRATIDLYIRKLDNFVKDLKAEKKKVEASKIAHRKSTRRRR